MQELKDIFFILPRNSQVIVEDYDVPSPHS